MALTEGQLTALRNLRRKQGGEDVDWINIGDARALTELGFAQRSRGGWVITPAGIAAAETEGPAPRAQPATIETLDSLRRPVVSDD